MPLGIIKTTLKQLPEYILPPSKHQGALSLALPAIPGSTGSCLFSWRSCLFTTQKQTEFLPWKLNGHQDTCWEMTSGLKGQTKCLNSLFHSHRRSWVPLPRCLLCRLFSTDASHSESLFIWTKAKYPTHKPLHFTSASSSYQAILQLKRHKIKTSPHTTTSFPSMQPWLLTTSIFLNSPYFMYKIVHTWKFKLCKWYKGKIVFASWVYPSHSHQK